MARKLKSLWVAVAASVTLAACSHANRPQPLPGQEVTVRAVLAGCAGGLEHFLPGPYYFCEGASHFWGGSFGMARESLDSAAKWADKPAQQALGLMYFNGDHAPMNRPLGVAWLALSAERHQPNFEATFVSAYRLLSPSEIEQANRYWRQMRPTYGDAFAAARAERRFDRAYREMQDAVNFGGSVYIDGLTALDTNGLSVGKWLKAQRDEYFVGYESHVWVGDAELVPIGSLPSAQVNRPSQPTMETSHFAPRDL
ncbi:hypothetical protein KPL74_20550 [Bacillus sp. NP157]|nr:hypothetical protein KPL74_20550 [Bacillus sp. NP157]